MMIKNTTPIGALDPSTNKPQKEEAAIRPRHDRVNTTEAQQALALVHSVRSKAQLSHTALLAQIENAIRSGTYRPSAGQLADKILAAAEIDARLQAMLRS